MPRRRSAPIGPLAAALCASIALAHLAPSSAHADPSAAELEAARGLFNEGLELEKKKQYAEALEKFHRVAEIKSTAIVRYHEGYCAEKSGKWIDALDAYAKAQLVGQGDPKQKDAVEASRKASDALRPRVPRIRVTVTGAAAGKAEVKIDGTPVSPALVGAAIPVDLGAHTVELSGAGVAADKREVTVVEKDTSEVAFEAKDDAPPPPDVAKPKVDDKAKTKDEPPKTKDEKAREAEPAPASEDGTTRFGLTLGLSVASISPSGQLYAEKNASFQAYSDPSTDQAQWSGTGAAVEGDVGLRFLPALSAYLFWQHGFLAPGAHGKTLDNFTATTELYGLGATLNTNPRGKLGFYLDFAVGLRATTLNHDFSTGSDKGVFHAFEPRLRIGAAWKPVSKLTLLAFVWASAGSYSTVDYTNTAGSKSYTLDTAQHGFAGFGLGAAYDLPIGSQR